MVIHTDIYFVITVEKRAYRQSRSRKTLTKLFQRKKDKTKIQIYISFLNKKKIKLNKVGFRGIEEDKDL